MTKAALTGRAAVWVAALFCLSILWLRTGLVPGASGGDEVWWSEAAYHWSHEGVLRWACLDDDKGSALVSYWPPVAPLLQAAMIRLFGLTPFGITAQSPLVCTLIVVLVFLLGRAGGLPVNHSLWAGLALFGLLVVERRLMQVRMENLTAVSGLAGLALLLGIGEARSLSHNLIRAVAAGAVLGLGLFCYYPQSPFLVLAFAAGLAVLPHPRKLLLGAALAAGTLPALAAGAAWILPHRDLFASQVLTVGMDHYVDPWKFFRAVTGLWDFSDWLRWTQGLEKWAVLILASIVCSLKPSPQVRLVAVMAVASSLPMFLFEAPPQVLAGILGVLLVFFLARSVPAVGWGRCLPLLPGLLVGAALLKFSLIGITALVQREGRDYAKVAAGLTALIPPTARVGISQEAWLALRATLPAANLHLLTYAPPSTENRPRVARTAAAADYYDCLVLQRNRLPALREVYPWLGPALDRGHFRTVRSIAPPFTHLPWAKNPNYDLVVYFRQGAGTDGPTLIP